jgi:crossover junction endodeoxyribonuclease RusA
MRRLITFILPFPPSLNNMFINGSKGRFRSQKYDSWIMEAGCEIMRQRPRKVAGPVLLTFEFQEGRDNRKRDISNLVKAPEDLLVKHGIIEADDGSIVRSITSKWSPEVQGVRVTIQSVFNRVPEALQEQTNGRAGA